MPRYGLARLAGTPASDHIYYNITISDDKTGTISDSAGAVTEQPTQGSDIPLVFNQIRATPYLLRPEEYYLTVIRFTIETPSFPLFIPQVIVGQSDVTKTIYTITLQYNGVAYSQSVIWTPQDETINKPIGPVKQADVSPANPYYYCYSYQHFADCINKAFKAATDAIQLATTDVYTPPYLQYNAHTNLFTLGGNVDFYRTGNDGSILGEMKIYFNAELYNLFASLPYIYTAGTSGLQMDYQLLLTTGTNVPTASPQPYITNIRTNNLITTALVNDVISVQEYQTLSLWCPIKSLIFKTSLLPTVPEIVATPAVYVEGDFNINSAKQNADILNIMIDYVPQLDKGTEYKPYIFYQPNGEYKLTELYGKQPVDALDISVFWKDSFGNLIPFTLSASSSATIKILFRKKSFNSTKV